MLGLGSIGYVQSSQYVLINIEPIRPSDYSQFVFWPSVYLTWTYLIWKVAHPVSNRTQPCLTSAKLVGLAGPLGHSPRKISVLFILIIFTDKEMPQDIESALALL